MDYHAKRVTLLLLLAVSALTSAMNGGCMSPQVRQQREEQRRLTPGDRSASPERRTADNRPRPKPPTRPFDTDRAGTEPYQADRTTADSSDAPQLRRFECLRLQEFYACPLLEHRWQVRDIPGGVELAARAGGKRASMLRDFVRCYHRFGQRDPDDQSCLSQFRPVVVTGGVRDSNQTIYLRLVVAADPRSAERIKKLRDGVRALLDL